MIVFKFIKGISRVNQASKGENVNVILKPRGARYKKGDGKSEDDIILEFSHYLDEKGKYSKAIPDLDPLFEIQHTPTQTYKLS